jgi:hypothetical protein
MDCQVAVPYTVAALTYCIYFLFIFLKKAFDFSVCNLNL